MSLADKQCEPCQGGMPPMGKDEAQSRLAEVPGWQLSADGITLFRRFDFDDFAKALEFVNKVGAVAEDAGHHPDVSFGWGYASVVFYTHKIRGLHRNDFIMAAKTDELFSSR